MHVMWTKEEERILRELAKKDKILSEACTVFTSRSGDSIQRKASRMGIPLRYARSTINEEAFKKLMKRGK